MENVRSEREKHSWGIAQNESFFQSAHLPKRDRSFCVVISPLRTTKALLSTAPLRVLLSECAHQFLLGTQKRTCRRRVRITQNFIGLLLLSYLMVFFSSSRGLPISRLALGARLCDVFQ